MLTSSARSCASTPSTGEVLVPRYSLDLPGAEVARLLGISPDAVRQRLARAKDAFHRVWED